MPRLDVRVVRSRLAELDESLLSQFEHGINGCVYMALKLGREDVTVEWPTLERALYAADIQVDICYSTGEHESPGIQELMPAAYEALMEYAASFMPLLPSNFRRISVWQNPCPGGRYEEVVRR